MNNKAARALAIVALVFMLIFTGSLIATLADSSLLNGGIGYLALSSGVFSLMVFFALRADGKIVSTRRDLPQNDEDGDDATATEKTDEPKKDTQEKPNDGKSDEPHGEENIDGNGKDQK